MRLASGNAAIVQDTMVETSEGEAAQQEPEHGEDTIAKVKGEPASLMPVTTLAGRSSRASLNSVSTPRFLRIDFHIGTKAIRSSSLTAEEFLVPPWHNVCLFVCFQLCGRMPLGTRYFKLKS